jgi:hypothetical protein
MKWIIIIIIIITITITITIISTKVFACVRK